MYAGNLELESVVLGMRTSWQITCLNAGVSHVVKHIPFSLHKQKLFGIAFSSPNTHC